MATILVTGGCGYIGSHTCVELINLHHDVIIVDNLYNSSIKVLDRIKEITGVKPKFYQVDILDRAALDHGSINLYEAMAKANVKTIVFSSSATVYGDPASVPIKEDFPLSTTNPYGTTKLYNEQILKDVYVSDAEWSILLLRYFNPIGAHKSGLLGETPNGIPNNLLPYIAQVATGKREFLRVWGNDYDTVDGTGVRDYIHVVDLALGHIKAIEYALGHKGVECINLGTGNGYSVLQVKDAFAKAAKMDIPYQIMDRRPGDIATCYADTTKAKELLGWSARYDIDDMCQDAWNFAQKNPNGIE